MQNDIVIIKENSGVTYIYDKDGTTINKTYFSAHLYRSLKTNDDTQDLEITIGCKIWFEFIMATYYVDYFSNDDYYTSSLELDLTSGSA